jgi:hypothetical protein
MTAFVRDGMMGHSEVSAEHTSFFSQDFTIDPQRINTEASPGMMVSSSVFRSSHRRQCRRHMLARPSFACMFLLLAGTCDGYGLYSLCVVLILKSLIYHPVLIPSDPPSLPRHCGSCGGISTTCCCGS